MGICELLFPIIKSYYIIIIIIINTSAHLQMEVHLFIKTAIIITTIMNINMQMLFYTNIAIKTTRTRPTTINNKQKRNDHTHPNDYCDMLCFTHK